MTTELNKVDLMVRGLLNTYPTLFKTRLDALTNIFSNSGYAWKDDGCMVQLHPSERDPTIMDYSDLDKGDAELANDPYKDMDAMSDLHLMRVAEAQMERLVRQHRATNIDIYAKENTAGARVRYETLKHLNLTSEYITDITLGNAPFGKIDKDWLAAAEEFIDVLKLSFNTLFGIHYDSPIKGEKAPQPTMFSRMPQHFQNLYTVICGIDDKLDAQSGRRSRACETMNRLLSEGIFDE